MGQAQAGQDLATERRFAPSGVATTETNETPFEKGGEKKKKSSFIN
jgi:hypothetical protein